MKEEIANELAEVWKETQIQTTENVATRKDIDSFDKDFRAETRALQKDIELTITELRKDIKNLETALRKDMNLMKQDIIIKLGSLMAIGITIIGILIKF